MNLILRGTMAHLLLQENTAISEVIQDIMLRPPEKYPLEIHLGKDNEVISLIILNIDSSIEKLVRVLDYFAKKFSKLEDPKYNSISHTFLQIIRELRKKEPLYPRNLFRLDTE